MDAKSRGYNIHYEVEGQGEPLILVPGLLTSIRFLHDYGYVAPFKDRYRVVILDPLGHGASDKPHDPSAYERGAVASDIVAVMDAEQMDSAHVWGYSRGGAMTVWAASAYPDRMRSIVVGGATVAPVLPEPEREAAAQRAVARDRDRIAALRDGDWNGFWRAQGLSPEEPVAIEMTRDNDSQAIAAVIEGLAQSGPPKNELLPLAGRILTYAGSQDLGLTMPGAVQTYMAACSAIGARLEILEGLNHIQGFERSDLVLPIVGEFLQGIVRTSSRESRP